MQIPRKNHQRQSRASHQSSNSRSAYEAHEIDQARGQGGRSRNGRLAPRRRRNHEQEGTHYRRLILPVPKATRPRPSGPFSCNPRAYADKIQNNFYLPEAGFACFWLLPLIIS